jgi:signal transduction histidine kinase
LSRVSLEQAQPLGDLNGTNGFHVAEVELVQVERATAAPSGPAEQNPLVDEIIARAAALAAGCSRPTRSGALLPPSLVRVLDGCEARARRLEAGGHGLGQAAALEFLGDIVAALAIDGGRAPGEAREAIARAAGALGFSDEGTLLATFRRAVGGTEFAKLSPSAAVDLILTLLVGLGPARAASIWALEPSGRTGCLAAVGKAPQSRRLREAARAVLDGGVADSSRVRAVVVERWDRPYGALVARVAACDTARLDAYLADAAAALAPILEREALFVRNVEQERELVAAGERRHVRLGFDLHDGPLQELVVFAEDIRLARAQMDTLIGDDDRERVGGRFADFEARIESLDRGLREIARSVRSTTALEGSLEDALRGELDSLARRSGIAASFSLDGDLGDLTDSQKIVLFRVVQESLANVRRHSAASAASVSIRSRRRFVDVTVTDNGRGFDRASAPAGRLGLSGISERARLLGGTVEIDSRLSVGTEVRITLPRWQPLATESTTPLYAASF